MFEERYHPNQAAVKAMAHRMAANSPEKFATTEDLVAAYGQEVAGMISRGGLLTALLEIGIRTDYGTIERQGLSPGVGLKTIPIEAGS